MKDKIPILIIILGIIATIFFFSSNKKFEEEIATAENIKKISDTQVEIYRDIDNHYGRASDQFYANKPIVVLRGSGATEVIRIYWEKSGKVGLTAGRDSDALETEWGDIDGKWIPYTITSKIPNGYRTITFTNKETPETFDVLVIIE